VRLELLATDPCLGGAAGRKPWLTNTIQVFTDKAGTADQAAGIASHEVKHWLQRITPSTYRITHEIEAYQFQRQAGYLSLTDAEILRLIENNPVLYGNVPK